jgi:hypothetical protein
MAAIGPLPRPVEHRHIASVIGALVAPPAPSVSRARCGWSHEENGVSSITITVVLATYNGKRYLDEHPASVTCRTT